MRRLTISPGTTASLRAEAAGLLRVREQGIEVEWSSAADPGWRAIAIRPPRLGEAWIEVAAGAETRLRSPARVAWTVEAALSCGPAPPAALCIRAIEAAATAPQPPDLAASGGEPVCAAFAAHDRAHRLSLAGKAEAAHDAYAIAAKAWRRAGDPQREAAALLGWADQSSNAGFAPRTLLEATRAVIANRRAGNAFFALRARATQALALRRLGREEAANRIYASLFAPFAEMREWGEWTGLHLNFGSNAAQRGDQAALDHHLAEIDGVEPGLLNPAVRGRIALLRMRRSAYAGDFAEAIRQARAAEAEFTAARTAGQLVLVARSEAYLYRLLGMHAEAFDALERAATLAPPSESPQRLAAIMLAYGAIEHELGRHRLARLWMRAAVQAYRSLGFVQESNITAAMGIAIDWRGGREPEALLDAIAELPELPQTCAPRADSLARTGRAREALAVLDEPRCSSGGLDLAIDQARARALSLAAAGERRAAEDYLLRFAESVDDALEDAGAALRFAVRRRLPQLRDAWIAASESRDPERWLRLVLSTHPYVPGGSATAPAVASHAIGRALLEGEPDGQVSAATRELVAKLVNPGAGARPHAVAGLAALQSRLGEDEWLLAWLEGHSGGRALWIGAHSSHLVEVARSDSVRAAVSALHASLRDPGQAPGVVEKRAESLSQLLFAGAPSQLPPARLWLLADPSIATIPLALLRWPGAGAALVETTDTGWVTVIAEQPRRSADAQAGLRILVSSDPAQSAHPQLPPLPAAALEGELIARARPGWPATWLRGAAASPQALADALRAPGGFVHVAAHGMADPERLGHAGVWLPPAEGESQARFLGWLELADQRLGAELAVFNACHLGASSAAARQGTPSFAAALANAGVGNVIAASWQTSDAATQVWVPAFYRALDPARPRTSAAALRVAQRALRDSPHFRHPWFWASLSHYRRLEIAQTGRSSHARLR